MTIIASEIGMKPIFLSKENCRHNRYCQITVLVVGCEFVSVATGYNKVVLDVPFSLNQNSTTDFDAFGD